MKSAPINFRSSAGYLVAGVLLIAVMLTSRTTPTYNVKNISIEEASALIDGGALVVDVRGKSAYDARHIPGALNIPLGTLSDGVPATLAKAKAESIVVYCGDGVKMGPEGTALLNNAGFSKAVNVEKGIQGWADAGLRVVKQ